MAERTVEADSSIRSATGIVFKKSIGQYFVKADGQTIACSISAGLRKDLVHSATNRSSNRRRVVAVEGGRTVDPVAIGDEVAFVNCGDGSGMITQTLPRRNKLSRRAAGAKPLEQVIAANVDQIVCVFAAANPPPYLFLLDVYLADAERSDIAAIVCITKTDLAEDRKIQEKIHVYEKLEYPVYFTSAKSGRGIAELGDALRDRLSVFVGVSGVGKTTLLNAIQPNLGLRVQETSEASGEGKHTTTHLEMFDLEIGGSIIDTPGVREFGLWDVDDVDIADLFREMRPLIGQCRFGANCSHVHEPGCAIKQAVEGGHIADWRYKSYLKMR